MLSAWAATDCHEPRKHGHLLEVGQLQGSLVADNRGIHCKVRREIAPEAQQ
jgi:hypothetical protein